MACPGPARSFLTVAAAGDMATNRIGWSVTRRARCEAERAGFTAPVERLVQ
jgi:hypothetical protein